MRRLIVFASPWIAVAALHFVAPHSAAAQQASLRGFVTDAATGEALQSATVVLTPLGGTAQGTVTDADGIFSFAQISRGQHALRVSFIGYRTHIDTLTFAPNENKRLNVALRPGEEDLGELIVETERTTGAARITAGQQTVRPADVELIPAPDISGDLAMYLTTLPGVVTVGDRGGQLFLRGGEASQNLVLLDGITLFQPFHVLGFFSAFPSDVLRQADVHAGGYGARFGGRLSSVIDVQTRNGNKFDRAGTATIAPFMSSLLLEMPVVRNSTSLLVSARRSLVEQLAAPIVGEPMPFVFGDGFVKLHSVLSPHAQLSIQAVTTFDRGTIAEDTGGAPPEEVRWKNHGISARYLVLPGVQPLIIDANVSWFYFRNEMGPRSAPSRTSSIHGFKGFVDVTYTGRRFDVTGGLWAQLPYPENRLGGLYQNVYPEHDLLGHVAFFVEPEIRLGGGLAVRPGIRALRYESLVNPVIEPRLRLIWQRGIHTFTGAAGLYRQEILGLSDRRDATNVFIAWTNIPEPGGRFQGDIRAGRIARATHFLAGYRMNPGRHLELSVEAFHKEIDNLFIAEWTAFPRFSTRLQPAKGRSSGADVRVELRLPRFYGYVTYGLSKTTYWAKQRSLELWYGIEEMRFRPPHDRRHQVNAVGSFNVKGFDVSLRWHFGSGVPFSRALGFDGFILMQGLVNLYETEGSRRVIYERPFSGVLPTYHRLDVSVERRLQIGRYNVTAMASVLNAYNRRNLFYLDVFTMRRVDQLPIVPSVGLKASF
ncbi:MAG TPA: TonB-dependent receptor [Rhodothermales bacterium]